VQCGPRVPLSTLLDVVPSDGVLLGLPDGDDRDVLGDDVLEPAVRFVGRRPVALSSHTPEHLEAAAAELNSRPRKTLGWETPAERLAKLLDLAS
jgi:hypothetical protein